MLISGPGLWNAAFKCGWHLHPPSSAGWWCAGPPLRRGRKGGSAERCSISYTVPSRLALVWRAARLRSTLHKDAWAYSQGE